uniref:Protein TIC 214 n=1 Tax=Saccoloma inaequale TaxID=262953 RepID=A0A5B9RFE6_9MONI|nr:conserved hypothetical chloroplast protein ycf1 [Saccoloma inaequale]QEG57850.1 conserved hypothetical chloroplast protein ycf1 [Saccoloma inaequale]
MNINLNILNTLSMTWIKSINPYILFGLYYGLLTTLPVGPSQILCIKSFLLGGKLSGLVSLSGSMLGQLVIISSIYCSPVYIFLSKPHVLTIVVIPYTILFCLTIKEVSNYQTLRPVISLRDPRVGNLFLNSFLFQILNPILLPNPVLARLIYLFFFRYSNNGMFLISSFLGWLTGHILFNYLCRLLLICIERDSPIIYLLVKRAIYTTFSIVFIINAMVYLGRAPVSFWTRKFVDEPHDKDMSFWEIAEYPELLWWFFKPWPNSFFDPSRVNRGARFIKNCRSDADSSIYKRRVSTYFFDKCITDGKQRLSFSALPSMSIFERQLEKSISKSPNLGGTCPSYGDWMFDKFTRNANFQNELMDRIELLETGAIFSNAIEKRTRLTTGSKKRIAHVYDPFLNKYRLRIPTPQTFLTVDELDLLKWNRSELRILIHKRKNEDTNRKNYLEDWIYARSWKWRRKNKTALPWETLSGKAHRIFQLMFKNRVLYDNDVQKILKKIRSSSEPNVTWEEILDLDLVDRALFLIYLKEEENCCNFHEIFLLDILSRNSQKRLFSPRHKTFTVHKIEDLIIDLARNNELFFDSELDVPGGESDVRYRRLRNLGISVAKAKPKLTRLVKRYAKVSDFRRRLLKGSMRSRRRKTLIWKILQEKTHSPFFLRLMEIPILPQLPNERLNSSNLETRLAGTEEETVDAQVKQQLNLFSSTRKSFSESELARSAVAARSDISPIHNGRGYMLIFQSKFRKFIKLPLFIASKTIGRIVLCQKSEWNKDWREWKKEIHINCTFDGEEFSQDQLPARWAKEGLQIKIIYPFQMKPWHTGGRKKRPTYREKGVEIESTKGRRSTKQEKTKFTYLTALGYQTDVPFGTIQKESSFWQPILKKLIWIFRKYLSMRTKQAYRFFDSNFGVGRVFKPNLSSVKEFNLIVESEEVLNNALLHENTRINNISASRKEEVVGFEPGIGETSERLLDIDGERKNINEINKELVTEGLVRKELAASDDARSLAILSNEQIGLDEIDARIIKLDKLALDDRLMNTGFNNFEEYEKRGFQEMILKWRIYIGETTEKSVLAASTSYQKANRFFVYYSNEFAALRTQLTKVINNSINEKGFFVFGPKKRLSGIKKLSLLSQAYLYGNIWSIDIKGNLDLSQLVADTKQNGNYDKKIEDIGGWNNDLTFYRPGQYRNPAEDSYHILRNHNSNMAKIIYSNKVGNYKASLDYYFVTKLDNKIAQQCINQSVRKCVGEWGFPKQLGDINAGNWNQWIDCLYKCNLPLTVWRGVAPHKWRTTFNHLDVLNEIERKNLNGQLNGQEHYVFHGNQDIYSIYAKNPFLKDRIRNLCRRRRYNYLLQSLFDFVRNGDTQKFSIRQDAIAQRIHSETRIKKISKIQGKEMRRSVCSQNSDTESKFNSKFDLMLWLVPDFAKVKSIFGKKAKNVTDAVLKDTNKYGVVLDISRRYQDVPNASNDLDDITLDERESADYMFRWKWKSEVESEKLRSLILIVSMLESDDQLDLAALCVNTGVDSHLLNPYFNAKTKLDLFYDLCVVSAHRFPSLFDDQNLIYKTVNPLLKIRYRSSNRINKRLYRDIYDDNYLSKILLVVTGENKKQSDIYNIEDLLLPRRRREFRFLQSFLHSLLLLVSPKQKMQYSKFAAELGWNWRGKEPKPSELSEVQKIKRFLWPSHRLEEPACIGRFCFDSTNASKFTVLKIRMYPILQK